MDPQNPPQTEDNDAQLPQPTKPFNKRVVLLIAVAGFLVLIIFVFALSLVLNSFQGGLINSGPTPTPVNINTQSSERRLVSVYPREDSIQADYTGNIQASFMSAVLDETVSFNITPTVKGQIKQLSPTVTIFDPVSDLDKLTKYTVVLTWSDNRNNPYSYSWSFTTDDASGEEEFTPQDARQFMNTREAADRAHAERKAKFPFLTQLPYSTLHFKIEITAKDEIIITTFGNSEEEHVIYFEEGKKWLTDNGGNISTLSIRQVKGE